MRPSLTGRLQPDPQSPSGKYTRAGRAAGKERLINSIQCAATAVEHTRQFRPHFRDASALLRSCACTAAWPSIWPPNQSAPPHGTGWHGAACGSDRIGATGRSVWKRLGNFGVVGAESGKDLSGNSFSEERPICGTVGSTREKF